MATEEIKIVSRADAIASREIRYFTGEPCKNGHIDFRSVKKWECYRCKHEREARRVAKNPDRYAQRMAVKLDRLRPARNAKQRLEYAKDPSYWLQRNRRWREINPERHREVGRAKSDRWRKANPEAYLLHAKAARFRRRALKLEVGGTHTRDDISHILKLQKRRCAYCRCRLDLSFHVDHIVSLSKGGSNDRRNLQITCEHCNLSKYNQDPLDFARKMGFLL